MAGRSRGHFRLAAVAASDLVAIVSKIFAPLFAVIWTVGSVLQYTGVSGPISDSLIAITFSCIWIAIWQGQK